MNSKQFRDFEQTLQAKTNLSIDCLINFPSSEEVFPMFNSLYKNIAASDAKKLTVKACNSPLLWFCDLTRNDNIYLNSEDTSGKVCVLVNRGQILQVLDYFETKDNEKIEVGVFRVLTEEDLKAFVKNLDVSEGYLPIVDLQMFYSNLSSKVVETFKNEIERAKKELIACIKFSYPENLLESSEEEPVNINFGSEELSVDIPKKYAEKASTWCTLHEKKYHSYSISQPLKICAGMMSKYSLSMGFSNVGKLVSIDCDECKKKYFRGDESLKDNYSCFLGEV